MNDPRTNAATDSARAPRRSDRVRRLARDLIERLCRRSPGAGAYRRGAAAHDLLGWGRRFLPAYFRAPPSKMHVWLAARLDRIAARRGARLNVLAPRGSAKSTVGTLCYVLRSAVEASEPYIWIVSATKDQAATHLENVKTELESSPKLARAYPAAVGRGRLWRTTAVELPNGAAIESFGAGQQLRGRRRREHRPTLIVCDDLENDIRAASPQQRTACRNWFYGVLLKAGDDRTNVVNLATALHRDALAMHLHRAPGWTTALFRAIERWPENIELWRQWEELYCDAAAADSPAAASEFFAAHRDAMLAGAELLWPEKEDLYALMRMRVEEGRTAFEREKQNSPIDPERCEWPADYFDDHVWFRDWPTPIVLRTLALDPSKGVDARHGDYSAFVFVGVDDGGLLYVEADMARRPTPQIVSDAAALCQRHRPHAFGVEANQFQDLLAREIAAEFRRQRRVVSPYAIHNHLNKQVRIRRLGPYLASRRLRFFAPSASTRLLVEQLRDFPLGDHDDGPDALEMAIRLAEDLLEGRAVDDGLGDRLIT
jgi:predicted phage terminase large subunit-like protein